MDDTDLLGPIVFDYLIQRERLLPLLEKPRFEFDSVNQQQMACLSFPGEEEEMRVPIEGEVPQEFSGVSECALVLDKDKEYQLFLATADTQEEADRGFHQQLIEFVRKEIGDEGIKRIEETFYKHGSTLQLEPTKGQTHFGNRVLKPRRNEPCPCGSGKKYKKCCRR